MTQQSLEETVTRRTQELRDALEDHGVTDEDCATVEREFRKRQACIVSERSGDAAAVATEET